MSIVTRMRRFSEIFGMVCFVALALYGLVALLRSTPTLAASQAPGPTMQQPASPGAPGATSVTVPFVMNYQGTLRDSEGHPLTGSYTMTLRIYAGAADPISAYLWKEDHANVTVREGVFNLVLGNNIPLPATLFVSPDRFMGVTVLPYDEMVPRQRLASVPYAIHAAHVWSLSAPDGDPMDALVVDNTGRVGIGTTNPQAQLDVNGDTKTTGNMTLAGNATLGGNVTVSGSNSVSQNATVAGNSNVGGNLIVSGKIGIGRTNPQAKLDVAGNLNFTGQKVCQALWTGEWKEVTMVPASWTSVMCADWARGWPNGLGAPEYILGCIFDNSFSWGGQNNGIPPSPNCGW